MDQLDVSLNPRGGLHVEGFPDAVKVIRLDTEAARRLADLSLHLVDLDFAAQCLDLINEEDRAVVRQALWRSALVHLFKCFAHSAARQPLEAGAVFAGDPDGNEAFRYIRDLRNKHVVHDESALTYCAPGAILNARTAQQKIAKVVTLSLFAETLDQGNWNNARLLVEHTRSYVQGRYDDLATLITRDLEASSYDDLERSEGITPRIPGKVEDASVRRPASD